MQYILLILCLIQLAAIVWLVMQVQKLRRPQDDTALRTLRQEIAADTQNQMQMLGNLLSENQRQSGDYQAERLEQMERGMDARLRQFESRVGNLERSNAQGMEQIRSAVAANLHRMQTQQQDSLAEIQSTVNEKLAQSLNQKIGQSFQLVSSRLEQVYQGLGEMQTLAVGVGDLKKVLSNVKTRGILGEVQLGAILQEILGAGASTPRRFRPCPTAGTTWNLRCGCRRTANSLCGCPLTPSFRGTLTPHSRTHGNRVTRHRWRRHGRNC